MEYQEFIKKANEVCVALSEDWKLKENEYKTMRISISNGSYELWLDLRGYGAKPDHCEISPIYPRNKKREYIYLRTGHKPAKIGVNFAKPADKIANDINKRLFPDYLVNLKYVKERILEDDNREALLEKTKKDIVEAGFDNFRGSYERGLSTDIEYSGGRVYEMKIRSDKLTPSLAGKILKLLKEA